LHKLVEPCPTMIAYDVDDQKRPFLAYHVYDPFKRAEADGILSVMHLQSLQLLIATILL